MYSEYITILRITSYPRNYHFYYPHHGTINKEINNNVAINLNINNGAVDNAFPVIFLNNRNFIVIFVIYYLLRSLFLMKYPLKRKKEELGNVPNHKKVCKRQ